MVESIRLHGIIDLCQVTVSNLLKLTHLFQSISLKLINLFHWKLSDPVTDDFGINIAD